MFSMLRKLILLIFLVGVLYAYRTPLLQGLETIYSYYRPCTSPIAYSLGTFDSRFGISQKDFITTVQEAESIWEKAAGRDLFQYKENTGAMKVNLVYDNRQEATSKLRNLGLTINDDKASYDSLKAAYTNVQAQYLKDKDLFKDQAVTFNARQESYNKEVADWNSRGGAPSPDYQRLEAEGKSLQAEASQIKVLQDRINAETEKINNLILVLNRLANGLNVDVTEYNTIGSSRGSEFTEGTFESKAGVKKIDVYEFDNKQKLLKVLAHEFGHALGLEHVEDPKAIMYRLNQSVNQKPTDADIAELKRVCKMN